jgi:protein CpxP
MTDQDKIEAHDPGPASGRDGRRRGWGTIAAMVLAVALLAGLTGNMLSTAFGQGFAWQHFSWHQDGFMGGPLSPAQIDDRIDRMTKHMAIELDATPDQQMKIAGIAKAAVADLRPLRDQVEAARARGLALLTAPTIDRTAIERLRAEQVGLAETASKRIAQALADASDVLSPEQRQKVAGWVAAFRGGPFGGPPWRHG